MKTSDLVGPALDWAVAKCENVNPCCNMESHGRLWSGWWIATPEYERMPCYSADWAQGGPIIEREKIGTWPSEKEGREDQWGARMLNTHITYGPTPLIAAMRCYVASKLGDEVEIPKDLE